MTIHKHQICLESEQHFDGRLPSHHLGFLLADLPVAVRGAVSMALCNRSKTLGKQPEWLKRASDLRFTGWAIRRAENEEASGSQVRLLLRISEATGCDSGKKAVCLVSRLQHR